MYSRILLSFFAVLALVESHDITAGLKGEGHKIYNETFEASPAIWRQVQNITVSAGNQEVISRIVVIDMREDKDGEAKIVEGGEGQKNVTIELKSPTALRGYQFKVEVFAVPERNAPKHGVVKELTPLSPAILSKENQPESTAEQKKNEDHSKGTTQSSHTETKDSNRPLIVGLEKDKPQYNVNAKNPSSTPSALDSKTTKQQAKDVPQQQAANEGELMSEINNGQGSIYPNVQPTSNGQLIRPERGIKGAGNQEIFTSSPVKTTDTTTNVPALQNTKTGSGSFPVQKPDDTVKNAEQSPGKTTQSTTNFPALANKTEDHKLQNTKTGSGDFFEQKTNDAVKNTEFAANKGDATNIHKIPLGKSNGSANNAWKTSQSSSPSTVDEEQDSFQDKGFFSNLGQLNNEQLTAGVKNLENSKATNNPESKTTESQNAKTVPAIITTMDDDDHDVQNDDTSSRIKPSLGTDQSRDSDNVEPFFPKGYSF